MTTNQSGVSFDGAVYSPFLTVRLPAWAGVRQNVTGSTVDGKPVDPSNASSMRYATVETPSLSNSALAAAAATSAVLSVLEPQIYFPSTTTQPSAALEGYRRELADVVNQLAAVSQQLQLVSARVDNLTRP
ncbi:IX [simian adenovirus 55]|uniref:IX n=1 Tax=simian adenovirus 55 TaxID=2848082 RepID=A0A1L3INX0_9ADEN|nr:IX [Simian mastadenovirus WIV19]APG53793.1 IX [Simian mastadenovirus WIV19]